jgi:hypothetical protein
MSIRPSSRRKTQSRLTIVAVLTLLLVSLAGAGAAYASPTAAPSPKPDWTTGSGSSSTNSPAVVTPDEFACHLHANQPTPGGGYLFIGYGAYNQCSGGGWYSGTVCVRLMGETHLGNVESTGAYVCKSGTATTLSVQPTADCPADPAYYYYSYAKATENDELGSQTGYASSTTELGSNMCA